MHLYAVPSHRWNLYSIFLLSWTNTETGHLLEVALIRCPLPIMNSEFLIIKSVIRSYNTT